MTSDGAAARYARALFDVALKESDPNRAEQELAGFVSLVSTTPQLAHVFANRAIPGARKRAVVAEIAASAGDLSRPVSRLLLLLAERDRLLILDHLLTAYRARLMQHRKVVRAEITTAVPLPEDRLQAIQRSLVEAVGQDVTVSTRVDPAIVGGVVAWVGSTVYDGSVVRQLDRMRKRIVENA